MGIANKHKCPICGSDMEKKHGRYGWFWGCSSFKKTGCRGAINILLKDFEFEYIDFNYFISDDTTDYLLKMIENNDFPKYIKELKNVLNNSKIRKGTIYRKDIEGKISGIFDYLIKKGKRFDVAKLAYWFYNLDGDLPGKVDYWLNRKPENEHRKEYHVHKALVENWDFIEPSMLGYNIYSEEYEIGKPIGNFGGYRIDLVCSDLFTKELIFIEIKGPSQKGISAKAQIIEYVRYYNRINPHDKVRKAYIVCQGYPRNVLDDDTLDIELGVIGYIIEDDKITFIPWKIV